jgi:superfamily I DNA/RNA helicase
MRLPDEEEEIVAPDLMHMPDGVVPVVIPLTSKQDETTQVINEIRRLVENGVPRRHILVIHANRAETQATLARLNRTFGPGAAMDPARATPGDQIRVCSLNAAAGLESPIVFLMGVHDLYEEEQSVRLSPEEQTELIRDNTRKLYMAITRAGQRLVLTYVGPLPNLFPNRYSYPLTSNQ